MPLIHCFIYLIIASTLPALITNAHAAERLPIQFDIPPKKVIFFGNSFTYYNSSLHYHLERMVRADIDKDDFKDYKFRAVTISGGQLTEHKEILPQLLAMKPWDTVILQGHSREAIDENLSPVFRAAATEMVAATHRSGGETLLFMTWAYQHKPEMIEAVSQAYTTLGRELGVPVVPVGLAFQRALAKHPKLKLHASDKVHPSPAGTYLAACTFYAVLYGQSPVGNRYNMWLKPEVAKQLQQIAYETVANYQQPTRLQRRGNRILVLK